MIIKEITYGLPTEDFIRKEIRRELRGDTLHVEEIVWPRHEVHKIEVEVEISKDPA